MKNYRRWPLPSIILVVFFLFGCQQKPIDDGGLNVSQDVRGQIMSMLSEPDTNLGYSCADTGTGEIKCVCKKGSTSLPWSCDGIDKMCKILDSKKTCRDSDGWCECIQGVAP